MKTAYLTICVGLFILMYYILWALTLPFFMARLFINALTGDDDELAVSGGHRLR